MTTQASNGCEEPDLVVATPSRRLEADELLFLSLLTVLTTTIGYRFGFGNQVEQLPIVMRLLDSSYLTNDFYVQSASSFGPRFYYAHIVAGLTAIASLPVVMFSLALLVNFAVATISHLVTRRFLGGDKLAGFVAATLVLAVSSFSLGLVSDIRFVDFQPGSLAIPFALAAMWAGMERRPVLAGALAAVGSIPHPLYGVETGAIALAAALVSGSFTATGKVTRSSVLRATAWTAVGVAVLCGLTFVLWGLPIFSAAHESIPTSELFSILAEFRAPHHYLPSGFPLRHYVSFAAFCIAAFSAWVTWRGTNHNSQGRDLVLLVVPVTIAIACIAGFVFVELWPSGLWITAQPFRMLYLVKWVGFLLLGWLIARWIREDSGLRRGLAWLALAGSSGGVQAPIACLCVSTDRVLPRLSNGDRFLPSSLALPAIAVVTIGLLAVVGSLDDSVLVALAGLVSLLVLRTQAGNLGFILATMLVATVVSGLILGRSHERLTKTGLTPVFDFSEHVGDESAAASWLRDNIDPDAILVAPPELGALRVLARRALVVDWKAVPFDGVAMREWRERIRFCYGESDSGGFEARHQLETEYRSVTDKKLTAIRSRYGARFAVLYIETPTARATLYANANYRVVAL